jgi:hypothetical protein
MATSSVEHHAACSWKVMVLETFLVHDLLSEDIASSKENLGIASEVRSVFHSGEELTADVNACVRIGRAATFP